MLWVLLSIYLVCSYYFMFSINSLFRIYLIVITSFVASLMIYAVLGFSWYLLLFILVYVGGVYILFIYVSLVIPNVGLADYRLVNFFGCLNVFILFLVGGGVGLWFIYGNEVVDSSVYLCSSYEFGIYLFFCVMLLLGIVLVNFIVSNLYSSCVR